MLDVVKAMVLLMDSELSGERFIITAENIPFRDVFTSVAKCFNKKPPYQKVTPMLAAIVWRIEAIKSRLSGREPMLTKETARTAQAKVRFDNSKLLKAIPSFHYTPINDTISRICGELKERHGI